MKNEKFSGSVFYWACLLLIAAGYLGFRLWRVADSCLFFDEIFSVHAAGYDWRTMFSFVARDLIHPPLFYVLLKIWIAMGGESIFWLRFFAVFFSALAIAPFLLLCRELKLSRIETLAAFALLAANGALIRYAQEVRMYSLLFCLSLGSLWLFVRFLNHKSNTNLIWLTLVNLLLVYTHYFGWLLIAAQFSAILIFQRERLKAFLASIFFLMLAFVPWLLAVWQNVSSNNLTQNIGWQTKPSPARLTQFLVTLTEPFYYQKSSADATNFWLIAVPVFLIAAASVIAYAVVNRKDFFNFPFSPSPLFPFFFTVAPVALAFAASWILPVSIWGTRHLIIVFAPAAILIAVALNRAARREIKLTAFAVLGALILIAGIRHFGEPPPRFIWCGWRELAAEIEFAEPTNIYVFEDDGAYNLWFALRNNPNARIISIDGYADMPEDTAYFLPRGFSDVAVADRNVVAGERFYLAFRASGWQPEKQVLQDLRARGYESGEPREFRAQNVSIFFVPIERINR